MWSCQGGQIDIEVSTIIADAGDFFPLRAMTIFFSAQQGAQEEALHIRNFIKVSKEAYSKFHGR